jgi:hypothetical protein
MRRFDTREPARGDTGVGEPIKRRIQLGRLRRRQADDKRVSDNLVSC